MLWPVSPPRAPHSTDARSGRVWGAAKAGASRTPIPDGIGACCEPRRPVTGERREELNASAGPDAEGFAGARRRA